MMNGELKLEKIIKTFLKADKRIALVIADENEEIINYTCIFSHKENFKVRCIRDYGKPMLIVYDTYIEEGEPIFIVDKVLRKGNAIELRMKEGKDEIIEDLIVKVDEIKSELNKLKEGDC